MFFPRWSIPGLSILPRHVAPGKYVRQFQLPMNVSCLSADRISARGFWPFTNCTLSQPIHANTAAQRQKRYVLPRHVQGYLTNLFDVARQWASSLFRVHGFVHNYFPSELCEYGILRAGWFFWVGVHLHRCSWVTTALLVVIAIRSGRLLSPMYLTAWVCMSERLVFALHQTHDPVSGILEWTYNYFHCP